MKKNFDPKTVTLGVWGLEYSFQQFGPKVSPSPEP